MTELKYTGVETVKSHVGIAMGLEHNGVEFIVLANSIEDLRKVKGFFVAEPLREESCKKAILVQNFL